MKILIVRFSSIGDIILTSPVIRCLHNQLENVEIHYATKSKFVSLLSGDNRIKKIHALDDNFSNFVNNLKVEKFDVVLDLHNNLRTARLKVSLGVTSFTFRKHNIKKLLLVKFGRNSMPTEHIVMRYIQTCQSLGVKYDGMGLDFFPIGDLPENISSILPKKYAVFAIGGTYTTKRLPNHKIKEFVTKCPVPLVLIGDEQDAQRIAEIDLGSTGINLCGRLNISQSAQVIQGAISVVAHDTGMMHISAAMKKPTISVWGNTTPDFGMWPLFPEELQKSLDFRSEVADLSCRPCSKLGFDRCPKGHFHCMELQNIDKIVEKLQDRLHS